jgi:uncharacterized membrane protein YgcG
MRLTNYWPVAAVVFLCGLSGCGGADKRGPLIRDLADAVNESADMLAQVTDVASAERYLVRIKTITERIEAINEKLGNEEKPDPTKIPREDMAGFQALVAKRAELGRDLEKDDVPDDPEVKGQKIIAEDEKLDKYINDVNALYGYAEKYEEDIKLAIKRQGAELARIRLLDPEVATVLKEVLKKFDREPEFTLDEISPPLYKEKYFMDRLILSLREATKIADTIRSEATANAALTGLKKEYQTMTIIFAELQKAGKNASNDVEKLRKQYQEVLNAWSGLLREGSRIKQGIVKYGRVPEENEIDPAMWPPVRDMFEQFEQFEFTYKNKDGQIEWGWEPKVNQSMGGGMMPGGMPGMGMQGGGGMRGGGMPGGGGMRGGGGMPGGGGMRGGGMPGGRP